MAEDNVECAFLASTKSTFLQPILPTGMLVRDLAIAIHDTCKFQEHVEVVLCDGETRAPLKGKQWIMPNTAVLVGLIENEKKPTKKKKGTGIEDKEQTQEHVHVLVDCVQLPDGSGVGGFARMNEPNVCIQTRHWLPGKSLRDMEEDLVQDALDNMTTRFETDTVCVIPHVYTTSAHASKTVPAGVRVQWVPMDTPELVRIRKFAVQEYRASSKPENIKRKYI